MRSLTFVVLVMIVASLPAASPQPFPLWPGEAPADAGNEQTIRRKHENREISWITGVTWPTLTVYPPVGRNTGAAVIICPGGGYHGLAYDLEGVEVAERFAASGVTGIVLKYRIPRGAVPAGTTPWPILDGQRAIQVIRARAAEWNIDPARIGILGFSAGGHLAATVSNQVIAADPQAADPVRRMASRPAFSVLVYPVISFDPLIGHPGSKQALIGPDAPPDEVARFSNELHVTALTPPAFLVHAADDGVRVGHSDAYVAALAKAGVPHEFIRLEKGGHGFGLGIHGGEPATWPERCLEWMRREGMIHEP